MDGSAPAAGAPQNTPETKHAPEPKTIPEPKSLRERIGLTRATAFTLGAGAVGGMAFAALSLPLAWMMGAMALTVPLALSGASMQVPPYLRAAMIAVLGVFLGSSFTPGLLASLGAWIPPIGVLAVLVAASIWGAYWYFVRVVKLDRVTAYFASAPGGLGEMVITGERYGASTPFIGIVHLVRIILVVSIVPIYFRFILGLSVPTMPPGTVSILVIPLFEVLLLLGCAVVGVQFGKRLHLPAPTLLGPLLFSAAAHASGLSHSPPPAEAIAMAQVIVGCAIGARFAGYTLGQIAPVFWGGVISAAGMIVLAILAAVSLSGLTGQDPATLFLAFAPGGLAEMSMIALAMGQDPAFVAAMHLVRITAIVAFVPLLFRMRNGPGEDPVTD